MDPIKAHELGAALQSANEIALQQELHRATSTAHSPQPRSAQSSLPVQAPSQGLQTESVEGPVPVQAAAREPQAESADALLPVRASTRSRLKLPKQAAKQQVSESTSQSQNAATASAKETDHVNIMPTVQLSRTSRESCSKTEVPNTKQLGAARKPTAAGQVDYAHEDKAQDVDSESEGLQQASISTVAGPKLGIDQTVPGRACSSAAAGKSMKSGQVADASPDANVGKGDAEPSSSKPASSTGKRAWQSKKAPGKKGQQVTLQRAFAKQVRLITPAQQPGHLCLGAVAPSSPSACVWPCGEVYGCLCTFNKPACVKHSLNSSSMLTYLFLSPDWCHMTQCLRTPPQ